MELDEYLWRNKRKMKDIAAETGYCTASLHLLRKRRGSPSLANAFKIFYATDGQVTLEEMLRKEDVKELDTIKKNFVLKKEGETPQCDNKML